MHLPLPLALAAALVLAACRATVPYEKPPVPVKIAAVSLRATAEGARYSASIRPSEQVSLAFRVGGYVRALRQELGADGRKRALQEGDRVSKGTVLARLREADFEVRVAQARARLDEAVAQEKRAAAASAQAVVSPELARYRVDEASAALDKAQQDHDRVEKLMASRTLTAADFDATAARLAMARATAQGARAQLAVAPSSIASATAQVELTQAGVAGARALLREAELALQDTAIRAPFDGVVLRRGVELGALAAPGAPAFVLADMRTMKAVFGVPDMKVAEMKLGSTLTLRAAALPGRALVGRITRVSPSADPASRVFEVEVTLPNADGTLRGGLIASLAVGDAPAKSGAIAVPLAAVIRPRGQPLGYAVMIVERNEAGAVARERVVKLGRVVGNEVAVESGLRAGEAVVVAGATIARAGEPVRIVP